MATVSFDFNKIDRSIFKVTMKDGKKLLVKMPMKKTFEKIAKIEEANAEEMTAEDALDILGEFCSEILSNNLQKTKVSTKYITDNYNLEEMRELIASYMKFTKGVKEDPN